MVKKIAILASALVFATPVLSACVDADYSSGQADVLRNACYEFLSQSFEAYQGRTYISNSQMLVASNFILDCDRGYCDVKRDLDAAHNIIQSRHEQNDAEKKRAEYRSNGQDPYWYEDKIEQARRVYTHDKDRWKWGTTVLDIGREMDRNQFLKVLYDKGDDVRLSGVKGVDESLATQEKLNARILQSFETCNTHFQVIEGAKIKSRASKNNCYAEVSFTGSGKKGWVCEEAKGSYSADACPKTGDTMCKFVDKLERPIVMFCLTGWLRGLSPNGIR